MLAEGESVIACVSGGCDSVALLLLLHRFCRERGHSLSCAHFDHMLRGAESDGDRLFVQSLCTALDIPFFFERQNADAYAKQTKKSLEEGARELRYAYFNRLAAEKGAKLAVAHNRNDRIETVLLNLARGTGVYGLKGISYIHEAVIRPLLDISREELDAVCREAGISYRNDRTNEDTFCLRNRIRLQVLPDLRDHLAADIDDKIWNLSQLAARDHSFLQSQAEIACEACVHQEEGGFLIFDTAAFAALHPAIQSRVVFLILRAFYPGGQGIDRRTVEGFMAFAMAGRVGSRWEAKKVLARYRHDGIFISDLCYSEENSGIIQHTVSVLKGRYSPQEAVSLCRKSHGRREAFDEDVLKVLCGGNSWQTQVRTRREGDYFTPYGAVGGKKLKKFLIDQKIPAHQRDRLPLLVCGGTILWICGVRRSNIAPVRDDTRHVIIFQYDTENDGR